MGSSVPVRHVRGMGIVIALCWLCVILPLSIAEAASIRISPTAATIKPDPWASVSLAGLVSGTSNIDVQWIVPDGSYVWVGPTRSAGRRHRWKGYTRSPS